MRQIKNIMTDVGRHAKIYPAGSGHFVYSGGMHGDGYVDYRPLQHEDHFDLLREVSVLLLRKTIKQAKFDTSKKITVCGPQTMGEYMVNAIESASQLGMLDDLAELNTRRLLKHPDKKDSFVWEADPSRVLKNAQNIWMDDLLNTGKTTKICRAMYEAEGARVHAVATIGDRCNASSAQLGVDHTVCLEEFSEFSVHSPDVCKLCIASVPIVRHPGHGHKFQENHVAHPGGYIESPGVE